MMHKAWSSIEEVPYCFSRSSVKFQGYTALKIVEFDPNWAFPDCNSSLNSPMAMKCCTKLENSKGEMPYCFPRSSIKFQGHTGQNITDFDPIWAFPDYRPVAAFKSLRFALFKVIRQISRSHSSKKLRNLTQIGRFQTLTPVCIHQWLRNDAQSFRLHRRGALLFLKVIHQISRSHGSKKRRSWPKLGVSGL